MSATDERRRLLDERGVRWEDISGFGAIATKWLSDKGTPCTALESGERTLIGVPDGTLSVEASITTAQAIEATLGRGTCRSIMHGIEYVGYVDLWTDEERLTDEEIVRCRDCKWCMAYSKATYCDRFAHELPTVEPDGFCAWGERKDK